MTDKQENVDVEGESQTQKELHSTAFIYTGGLGEYLEGRNNSLLSDKRALPLFSFNKNYGSCFKKHTLMKDILK